MKPANCTHEIYVQKQGRIRDLIDEERVTIGVVIENRGRARSALRFKISTVDRLLGFLSRSRPVFPNQGSTEHSQGFREKLRNEKVHNCFGMPRKILKYCAEYRSICLYGSWRYIFALLAVSLFCFGQSVFKII